MWGVSSPPFVFACDTGEKWRTLTVLDLKAKGKIRWQQKAEDPLIGGVLATAGGLVFTGEGKGDLIVTASNMENDLRYGSCAEARL